MNKFLVVILLLAVLGLHFALAVDFNQPISDDDKKTFDAILEPVMKVYNFIKYASTIIAVLFLVFAGVNFITSGNDQAKRESSKTMAMYVLIGLIVIWVAPLIVGYLV